MTLFICGAVYLELYFGALSARNYGPLSGVFPVTAQYLAVVSLAPVLACAWQPLFPDSRRVAMSPDNAPIHEDGVRPVHAVFFFLQKGSIRANGVSVRL